MNKNIKVKFNKNKSLSKRENIKIKISKDKFKKTQWGDAEMEELESRIASLQSNSIGDELLSKAAKIAKEMKRSELVLFWLQNAAEKSERYFDAWFEDIQSFSKLELIDIMHELGLESLKRFIETFTKPSKKDLQWTNEKRKKIESKILSLRNDQIAALLNLVGLDFYKKDIEEVVKDIIDNKHNAGHLLTLINEANSKENLLWWIDYFEKANKR